MKPKNSTSSKVDEVIESVVTRDEVNTLLSEVEALAESAYKVGEKSFKTTVTEQVSTGLASAIKADIGDESRYEDMAWLSKWLGGVGDKLRSIEVVEMELAWEPNHRFVEKMVARLCDLAQQQVVVNMKIDTRLIGGARLTYGGKLCDFTILGKWGEIWREVEAHLQK